MMEVVSPTDRCTGANGVAMDKFCSFANMARTDCFRKKPGNIPGVRGRAGTSTCSTTEALMKALR